MAGSDDAKESAAAADDSTGLFLPLYAPINFINLVFSAESPNSAAFHKDDAFELCRQTAMQPGKEN
jgi:hypothetical protein